MPAPICGIFNVNDEGYLPDDETAEVEKVPILCKNIVQFFETHFSHGPGDFQSGCILPYECYKTQMQGKVCAVI